MAAGEIPGIEQKRSGIRIPKLRAVGAGDYTGYYILGVSAIFSVLLLILFAIDFSTDMSTMPEDADNDGMLENPEASNDGRFSIPLGGAKEVKKDKKFTHQADMKDEVSGDQYEGIEWYYVKVYTINLNWQDFLPLALIVLFAPYAFYESMRRRRLDRIEDKFPDFIKDLAEYWKGGLSMTTAIDTISRGEYGALNKDVRIMATQISWGVAFEDVLRLFADRVKTPLVQRTVMMVSEANKAGGKISDILLTAAADAREIRFLKDDRRRNLGMYNIVIYISFAVYLAVIVILSAVFLPAIAGARIGAATAGGMGGIGGIQVREINPWDIDIILWGSTIVQALGNGMMGGTMSEGSFSAGFKHISIMLLLSWLAFKLMVFPGLV